MKLKKDHTIWAEKYRPGTLDTYVGSEEIKTYIETAIKKNDVQHSIFHGKTGTGKTTAAKLLMLHMKCDSLYINGSDENGIDTVREKIKTFVSTASFQPLKLVVLDDCQNFTPQAQQALLNLIESYSNSTRFIFTCNALGKLIPALQGRCETKKVQPPDKSDVAQYLFEVLEKEAVSFEIEDLGVVVNKYFPDIRKSLNVLQAASFSGTLVLNDAENYSSDYIDQIISTLTSKGDRFKTIRQIVADNGLLDFTDVYKALYERLEEFVPKTMGEACLYIAEGEYESAFVPDREITFMKVIHNIISLK